ncbi:MAG: DUF1156 domain-containing protein [Pseudomonadota bacterium]
MNYPKRLIEVDLPIARISKHARREKSIRHGHISTLHIWWARRPLAACRAVICASLWPDPVDLSAWMERGEEISVGDGSVIIRPKRFLDTARERMTAWAKQHLGKVSQESYSRFIAIQKGTETLDDPFALQRVLLDFIADFANWDNSTDKDYLETARALTQSAHEALGGEPDTRPLVVDPFAGGGSIPLEALRVGADAFASDLNPVAVLLNKVVLEYIPKYGQRLADEVRKWGAWIKQEAEKELAEFYPKDPDGATPIAYLWARTIQCEGPGCGAEVPLMRSLWLAKKEKRSVALRIIPNPEQRRVDFEIIKDAKANDVGEGTVRRGSATCPCCGYTTPVASVRVQLKARKGGAHDARLFVVVTTHAHEQGRFYRLPTDADLNAVRAAVTELEKRKAAWTGELSLVPEELTPRGGGSGAGRAFSQRNYGMEQFCDLFTPRQLLSLTTLGRYVREAGQRLVKEHDAGLAEAVQTGLALLIGKQGDLGNSLCRWEQNAECPRQLFGRQAIPIVWDFAEGVVTGDSSGAWNIQIANQSNALASVGSAWDIGTVSAADAANHPLPDNAVKMLFTDPPYYDAVPYADLSDFFHVWLKRGLPGYTNDELTPKANECIVDEVKGKDKAYFERTMGQALAEGQRFVSPEGIGVVVFAHKSTSGWEAQLQAMINAGWIVTGSWPVDTECGSRLRAMNSAALASSVHIIVRPRENPDGSLRTNDIGDWRDVLTELPQRIHSWMPRLAEEGVVGADAIFACLGPALEVFSRYSRVEKSSGEAVTLGEYLEHVWAAVSKEALSMIFKDPDTASLEPDARLTAMWLWTLGSGNSNTKANDSGDSEEEDPDDESDKTAKVSGFILEFDAARKIAQGLGVHLEKATSVVEVTGSTAKLLSVAERVKHLFGKDAEGTVAGKTPRKKKPPAQQSLFAELEAAESSTKAELGEVKGPKPGITVLDRLHQAMILFAAGRGEALKRFLVEEGIGNDARFWKLAQSLTALYPGGSDEKRWVDGVLARKKGLGF